MCRLERGWEAAAECETNEDCIEVPATVRCIRSCDSAVVVNQAQSEAFAEAVSDSNAACDGFDSGGCMFPPGGPCAIAAPRTPACLEGKCAAVAGCNTTAQSGSASIADARPQLAVGCSADEQCTVQSIASANWECPEQVFVSDASRASYDQLLYELNMRSTATDGADSCRGPSCEPLATPELTCEEGTCVVKKVTREEIQVQIDALNHCEVTADCEAVSIAPCGTEYIAKGSDRSELDALLSEYIKLIGPVGCDGSCACGLLECVEQRCTTRASDCMEMPEGTTNVCL
jgi:hypothetical protein